MPNEKSEKIVIHIDKKSYHVEKEKLSGKQLKDLADPKIGDDRDLFLKMSGHEDDKLITDEEMVELENGMHFYSVPKVINPGVCTY